MSNEEVQRYLDYFVNDMDADEVGEFLEEIEKEDFVFDSNKNYNTDELMIMRNHDSFAEIDISFLNEFHSDFPRVLPCLVTMKDFMNSEPDKIHYAVLLDSNGAVSGDSGSVITFYYQEDSIAVGDEF